jgi:hypothetical protein
MTVEETQGRQADIALWKDRIVITALSGRGLLRDDPDAFQQVLTADAPDYELAASLQAALLASRFLATDEARAFFQGGKSAWEERIARTATAAGATSTRAFLNGMSKVAVAQRGSTITLTATRKLRGPAWQGITGLSPIELPAYAEPTVLVAGIRRAASLCVA